MAGMTASDVKQTMQRAEATAARVGADIPLDSVLTAQEWEQLHRDVFDGSDTLEHLQDYARAHYVPPIAFLLVTLTRIAAASHPTTVNAGLGPTPLNTYLVLVGDSGMGKDSVISRSTKAYPLVRTSFPAGLEERPLGSGESLVSAFMPPAPDKDDPAPKPNPRVLFTETEISNAETLMKRDGATLRQNLLKLYSGSTVGNATKNSVDTVAGGTYSTGLIIGAQRGRVGALLDNPDDGLPHRFMWTELLDPNVPSQLPKVGPELDAVQFPKAGTAIQACGKASGQVKQRSRLRLTKGYTGGLDSHLLLTRVRIAALLAVFRGHAEDRGFTDDDWRRAGALVAYSKKVRESCNERLQTSAVVKQMTREEAEYATRRERIHQLVYDKLRDSEQVRVSEITNPQRRWRNDAQDMIAELVHAKAIHYVDKQCWIIGKGETWQDFARSRSTPS
ncbi:hypothetical protein HMPREF2562_09580 [Corynebacterium sp. HMSC077G07]|uniref:hypothetical protein n=1 Tax=Corynebacterium sp. HMSC077G07 TaxID=1715042 RepID=UPI0008A43CFB|nr:hypothetical protein [Corynebacterium sp. HMSC077G07]OFN38178.1 hypothetical protein HMPREF2562_09580 [Corynebacterium sp. HMSC077G07]